MSEIPIFIKNGRVIDPSTNSDKIRNLLVINGKIKYVNEPPENCEIMDATGLIIMPGLIDMHTHLREPGEEHKETIETGIKSAIAGGFTSIACMPNTHPAIDNAEVVKYIREKANLYKFPVYPVGAVSVAREGKELALIGEMFEAGAVAFSDDGAPVANSSLLRSALEYSKIFNVPIIDHCEDLSLTKNFIMHEGAISSKLGLSGYPGIAEAIIVYRDISIAGMVDARIHIAHVSSKNTVEIIRDAKKRGIKVTAEVTPHHLSLTDEYLTTFDTNFKMNPPLREKEDIDMLIEGINDGTIDAIATDHAPHSLEEKELEIIYAPYGVIGLETAVSVIITYLINKKKLSWLKMAELMSYNPAKILNIPGGTLKENSPAYITIINPDLKWKVGNKFVSRSSNSPYIGMELKGKVVKVIMP